MTPTPITHCLQVMLGVFALALATSCVPQGARREIAHRQRQPDADTLLRGLALTVPTGIADPGPAAFDDPSTSAVSPLAAPAFLDAARTPDDTGRATDCLTAAVYYEARSQSVDGQRAVAQVVLNRVRDRAFPNSVCGVVYQGANRRTGCQFSFTCDGSMYRPKDEHAWARAQVVATAALSGEVYAPVGAATFYHANSVLPWWSGSLTRIGSVGAHIFYRWRGAMENALAFRQRYSGIEPVFAVGEAAGAAEAVAIHYADEMVGAVTIHRQGSPLKARIISVSGVRIHRGGLVPIANEAPSDQGIATEDGGRT